MGLGARGASLSHCSIISIKDSLHLEGGGMTVVAGKLAPVIKVNQRY